MSNAGSQIGSGSSAGIHVGSVVQRLTSNLVTSGVRVTTTTVGEEVVIRAFHEDYMPPLVYRIKPIGIDGPDPLKHEKGDTGYDALALNIAEILHVEGLEWNPQRRMYLPQ